MKGLQPIGSRIIKTTIAVFVCMLIFTAGHVERSPFYVLITTIICIQPDMKNEKLTALNRALGTLIGAFTGAIAMTLESVVRVGTLGELWWDALNAIMILITIYLTVILEKQYMAFMACVAYLSVATISRGDMTPYEFLFFRVLDTFIGVGVGYLVCLLHIPSLRRKDVLFVAELNNMENDSYKKLTDFNKTALNKLIDEGASFTLITKNTPASMLSETEKLNLNIPVIALDGAVLYDVKENKYLATYTIEKSIAEKLISFFEKENCHYFMHVIIDDVLLIYYQEFKNDTQAEYYQKMRKSPYRNYINRESSLENDVLYFSLLDTKENIQKIVDKLSEKEFFKYLRYWVEEDHFKEMDLLKIVSKDADAYNMLEKLRDMLDLNEIITFGSEMDKYNFVIPNNDFNKIIKHLHKEFEGIKNLRRKR